MDTRSILSEISKRASDEAGRLQTEEATKNALIMPFIQNVLGFDVFNPAQVQPEFTADYSDRQGEKVDYALMQDDNPAILVECKKLTDGLDSRRTKQLGRYFHYTTAKVGILTNGVVYQFYTDLAETNKMDSEPFLTIDIRSVDERAIQHLTYFNRDSFDPAKAREQAVRLRQIAGIKTFIEKQFQDPDDEFVRMAARQVHQGRLGQQVVEHYSEMVKTASQEFLNDRLSDVMGFAREKLNRPLEQDEEDSTATEGAERGIYTSVEEVEGYELVKVIVSGHIAPERVHMRDSKSYCRVLLDDNQRKPICRLYFNDTQKKSIVIVDRERTEQRYQIESVNDIGQYADQLIAAAQSYLGSE